MREPPKQLPPDAPQGLAGLIQRCLTKDPGQRYQHASEVRAALEVAQTDLVPSGAAQHPPPGRARLALGAAGAVVAALLALAVGLNLGGWRDRMLGRSRGGDLRSLAVLPLDNLSGDPQQEYLSDGMTEALIGDLAQIRALRVVSRTSVLQYKQARKALPEIARAVSVNLVVEGSVVRVGDRVRVSAQLIDAGTDRHLWAKSYERELGDVLVLQRELARSIAQEIRVSLTPQEQARLTKGGSVNPESHQAYLMGRYAWNKRTEAGFQEALEHFQRSLEKDPAYAPAYAGIADTYNLMQFYTGFSPHAVFPRARAAARKALELDETLAEAHAALAYVAAYYDWDWARAEQEFQRALELSPNSADAYHSYSRFLAARGRVDEALVQIKRAQERDPVPLILKANEAMIFYFARQPDLAIEKLRHTLELDPNFVVAHWGLALAHEQRGAYPDALAELEKTIAISRSPMLKSSLGHTYAVMGIARRRKLCLRS